MKLYQRGFERLNNGICAPFNEGMRALVKIGDDSGADVAQTTVSWVGRGETEEPAIGEWVPEVIIRVYKITGEED